VTDAAPPHIPQRSEEHAAAWAAPERSGPLAGIRVLDLSRILAGPLCTCILGDLGAEVIKVERPGGGDETRRWGPPWHGDDAVYYFGINRNRRSVALDLTDATGREAVLRLAGGADVVVENFLPAQYEALHIANVAGAAPHAVWCSVRAAGSDGPDAAMPGYDVMTQARSGIMSITGDAECGPVKAGIPVSDIVAGLYAAVGVCAALQHRSATGVAQRVEVPLLECSVSVLLNQALNLLVGGVLPGLMGNRHVNIAPYGAFACSDGHVVLGGVTEESFAALCTAIGAPHIAGDPRFSSNRERVAHREQVDAEIERHLAARSVREWVEVLRNADVPCAPVNSIADVFADPHIAAVGMAQTVDHPAGAVTLLRSPLRFSATPASIHTAPPLLGEHTAAVLRALALGGGG